MKKVALICFALVLIFSCAKKINLFITGGAYRWIHGNYQNGYTEVGLMCDPILKSITIKVNGKELPVYGDTGRSYDFYAYDTIIPSGGSEQKLEVKTDVGNADATSKIPGDFTTTIPNSIGQNTDLSLSWTEATDADWYMVFVEYDTGYYYYYFYKDTMIYTTQKSLTIAGSWFDKDGELYVYIVAGDGPKIEAGASGNINGAKGFWLGINQRAGYVQVGQSSQLARSTEPKKKTKKEICKAYLKEMAKYNEDAEEILKQMK